ncbi:MAG: lipid A deacylase LpxR family protein [Burkholderiaceae bacterium]
MTPTSKLEFGYGPVLRLAVAICLAAAAPTTIAAEAFGLSLQSDNDEYAGFNQRDRWYSNGARATLTQVAERDGWRARMLAAWCDRLAQCAADATPAAMFAIGQNIYTQNDRTLSVPLAHDRPIAGWLYLAAGALQDGDDARDAVQWQLGVTGPAAYGEQTQNLIHDALGVDRAPTWRYQLRPRLGVNLHVERNRRIGLGSHLDAVGHVSASLGNILTQLSVGAMLRLGWGLRGAVCPSEAMLTAGDGHEPRGVSLHAGFRLSAVAYNAFLDGRSFGNVSQVRHRPFVGELFVGVGIPWHERGSLRITIARRSIEFQGPGVDAAHFSPQTYGQIALTWRLP